MDSESPTGLSTLSFEELVDIEDLRSVIARALGAQPVADQSLRRGVWSYVCAVRNLGMPPGQVIVALTTIVEASKVAPRSARDAVMRRVILWCVDAYFGHLGERVGDAGDGAASGAVLPPVRASNR